MGKEALSLSIREGAVKEFTSNVDQLKEFVRSQLREEVDFATLKGTSKPSLLKPGAEKLARIFGLGNRILDKHTEIDHKTGFAMSTVTVEIFHIQSGLPITQSLGSANTFETSHESKPYPVALNHILKMAQKRAFVGAVIMAIGASDFFTQDVEDFETVRSPVKRAKADAISEPAPTLAIAPVASSPDPGSYRIPFGQHQGVKLSELNPQDLEQLEKWVMSRDKATGKVLQCREAILRFRKS